MSQRAKYASAPCFLPCLPETNCPACYPPEPAEPPMHNLSPRTRIRRTARNRIGDRDGWVCGFCRRPVDNTVRWPHPVSPSVGHILWRGGGAGGSDDPSNLRIEHLACNMKNCPPLRTSLPHPIFVRRREDAGLPPYTVETWEEERQQAVRDALANPKPARTLEECIWLYWLPGMSSWTRWHEENPAVCDCTPIRPCPFCWPPIPDNHPRAEAFRWALACLAEDSPQDLG